MKEKIRNEILTLKNIEEKPNKFGNISFYVNGIEFCHFHSNNQIDIRKPKNFSSIDTRIEKNSFSNLWLLFNFQNKKDMQDMINIIKKTYKEIT